MVIHSQYTPAGFQHTSVHGIFWAAWLCARTPTGWPGMTWSIIKSIIMHSVSAMSKLHVSGSFWALHYALSGTPSLDIIMLLVLSFSLLSSSHSMFSCLADDVSQVWGDLGIFCSNRHLAPCLRMHQTMCCVVVSIHKLQPMLAQDTGWVQQSIAYSMVLCSISWIGCKGGCWA